MTRQNVASGAPWEEIVGYSRLVRIGPHIWVTGTTAFLPGGGHVGDGDAYAQAMQIGVNLRRALAEVGAGLEHVVRTRMFITDAADSDAVGRAHEELFGAAPPVATMVIARLLDTAWKVELEVEAELPEDGAAPPPGWDEAGLR